MTEVNDFFSGPLSGVYISIHIISFTLRFTRQIFFVNVE